jgi:hypothetical protein
MCLGREINIILMTITRFLAQAPLEAKMVESSNDPTIDWRSPQRAGMAYFRVILESLHYLMRRKGISVEKAKQVISFFSFHFLSPVVVTKQI